MNGDRGFRYKIEATLGPLRARDGHFAARRALRANFARNLVGSGEF
jgi:hypothetical protein